MVLFHNSFYQGESQSPAPFFGGHPGGEDGLVIVFGDAVTGIRYQYIYGLSPLFDLDGDLPLALHGIDPVLDQVFDAPIEEGGVQKDRYLLHIARKGKMDQFGTSFLEVLVGLFGFGHQIVDLKFGDGTNLDRKSTRLNSSHVKISYAVF